MKDDTPSGSNCPPPGSIFANGSEVRLPHHRAGAYRRLRDRPLRMEVVGIALVMLIGLVLRIVALDSVPGNITADEADNLKTIFEIQVTGEPGPFDLDWKPQPAMSMYLFAGFMAVFGDDIFGMRMASAVMSTLALLPFYALARHVVQPAAALGGALLFATGLWYLNFSRSGWENVHTALYALLAAWALTVALERRQLRWFALAGVAATLGLYGYFAGRLILIALLAYAPVALWLAKGYRWPTAAGYALLTVTALALFAPQVPSITEDRETFNRRTEAIFVLDQPRPYKGEESDFGIIAAQTERTIRGFFLFDGDGFKNGRYGPEGKTLYDPITNVLLLAGLGFGIHRWRETGLWWVMLFIPLIGTQVLSTATPNGARAITSAPFIYLFATLALDYVIRSARRWRPQLTIAGVAASVIVLSAVNIHNYFDWIRSPETIEERKPAVELAEYDRWSADVKSDLKREKSGPARRDLEDIIDIFQDPERSPS